MTRKNPATNDSTGFLTEIEPIRKHSSMAEAVYFVLKDAIVDGNLKAGQRLVEQKLSSSMKVSRAPVREAIKRLEQGGFLQKLPTRGIMVRRVLDEDIDEVYEVRAILEGYAVTRIFDRENSDLITSLEGNIRASLKALRKGDVKEVAELDDQFHHTVHGAVKGEMLATLIRMSMDYTAQYRRRFLSFSGYAKACVKGHRAIVEAIREGNRADAEAVMRSHILLDKLLIVEGQSVSTTDPSRKSRNQE